MTVKESPVEAEGRMVQRELPEPNPQKNKLDRPTPVASPHPRAKPRYPEQGTHLSQPRMHGAGHPQVNEALSQRGLSSLEGQV